MTEVIRKRRSAEGGGHVYPESSAGFVTSENRNVAKYSQLISKSNVSIIRNEEINQG
jgi:hypothetical protein